MVGFAEPSIASRALCRAASPSSSETPCDAIELRSKPEENGSPAPEGMTIATTESSAARSVTPSAIESRSDGDSALRTSGRVSANTATPLVRSIASSAAITSEGLESLFKELPRPPIVVWMRHRDALSQERLAQHCLRPRAKKLVDGRFRAFDRRPRPTGQPLPELDSVVQE